MLLNAHRGKAYLDRWEESITAFAHGGAILHAFTMLYVERNFTHYRLA